MEKRYDGKKEKRNTNMFLIKLLIIMVFSLNTLKFLNLEENDHPLVSTLFTMIFLLSFLVLLLHKKEISEEYNGLKNQTLIGNYFKKAK